jgi:hypothetical protein
MSRADTGTQYRGPLAGLGAGAAAVLTAGGLVLIAARRQLGEVATVIAWALMTAVVGAVIAAGVCAVLWLRHLVLHPEVLSGGRQAIRAEVVDDATVQQAAQAPPERSAIQPPRVYLNVTPDQLAAILRHRPEEE